MMRRLLFVSLFLLAVTGCSATRRELDANPPFTPHHYRYHDMEVKWQTGRTDGMIRLEGTVTNRRYAYMWGLETTVRLMDAKGKILARETFADYPTYLAPGKTERFRMEFRLPPDFAPKRLSFSYIYWLVEEPPAFRRYDDNPHFGHFDSPL
jgi:hypothetical protein